MCSTFVFLVFFILHDKVKIHSCSHLSARLNKATTSPPISSTVGFFVNENKSMFKESTEDKRIAPDNTHFDLDIDVQKTNENPTGNSSSFDSSLELEPNSLTSNDTHITNVPEKRAPKEMIKEISNFPVNVMKVVKLKSSTDPKSPHSKRLRQIESRTSSVRVVISRAPRNASTTFLQVKEAADNAKKINLAIGSEDTKKDFSIEDQNFEESVNSEESTGRSGAGKAESLTRSGKLSSKYRASSVIDKKSKCFDLGVKCVRYNNVNRETSNKDSKERKITSNSSTLDDGILVTERSIESGSRNSHPNFSNNMFIEEETTKELATVPSSNLPEAVLNQDSIESSAQLEHLASNKISQTHNTYDTFQEKVKQIREILKEIEYNDDSSSDDYEDYDSDTIPAQFKYLSLFEEKYGSSRRNGEPPGSLHNPLYGRSSSYNLSRSSLKTNAETDVPGMISDSVNEKKDIEVYSKFNNNNDALKEDVVPVTHIDDVKEITDRFRQQDKNRISITDRTSYARDFPIKTPIWMVRNITAKRLQPTPFSKTKTLNSNEINCNEDEIEEKRNITETVHLHPVSPLRSANEKLMKAVETLFKVSADTQIKHKSSTKISYSSHHENQSSSIISNKSDENPFHDQEDIREESAKVIPEEMSQFNNLLMDETSLQKDSRMEKFSSDIPTEPVNTFLYDYEDNALDSHDPLTDQTPLFLDTGHIEFLGSSGDKKKGRFEHFSSNDLDSDRFTSSFSNAQIKMYELYRDQLLSGSALDLESSNSTTSKEDPSSSLPLIAFQYQESRCFTGSKEGLCFTNEICRKKGGQIGSNCNFQGLFCCTFTYSCGDISKERVTYFKSPRLSARSGSGLTCDYDVSIRPDVCAVRIEFEKVNLARKLGGICDMDQLFILNSIDGPTTAQCGPLSGYATTVAVKTSQTKPLKIALIIQGSSPFYWYIKLTQLSCSHVLNFRAPLRCGKSSMPRSYELNSAQSWHRKWHRVPGNKVQEKKKVWWRYPEPILNSYYFSATKRHLQALHTIPLQSRQARRRIVSGSETDIGEFPWQVAIALDGMFFCGGALLNEQFVLTAAHCIMTRDTPVSDLVLHLGDHDLLNLNETAHVRRGVRRVLFHSHFHPFVLSNDIALLQLDRPVVFSDTIQPVCLPQRGESFIGKRGTVVGWGVTSYPMGEPSPTLQKLQVKVLSNARCSTVIEETIGSGMLCAAPDETQGTCFGDSGGPLTFEQDTGYHVLAGIVSYGVTGCAIMPAYPDLYTRVSEYLRWINVNAIVTK